ncbi:MAG: esterase-like activity of phytase family protein [Rhodobacteraceae bacterium]|nr:esterase-like activity of phytase family protein [Paracoccaceae bacterium]
MPNLNCWARRRLGAMGLCVLAFSAIPLAAWSQAQDIIITMTPLSWPAGKQRIDALTHVGGWEFRSDEKRFGGLSGLEMRGENGFAVTDRGAWLTFSFDRAPNGVLTGLKHAQMALLRDAARQPLTGRSADAEALAVAPGGRLAVSFEGGHRIEQYAVVDGETLAETAAPAFELLPRNGGLEALATAPDGALIAIAEEPPRNGSPPDAAQGWRIAAPWAEGETPSPFRLDRRDGFAPTGAAFGPDKALYLVERRFHWMTGVAARVRRFPNPDFASGDLGGGEVLATLSGGLPIDNMEAITVEASQDGALLLTLLSDDNFSGWQRTLLLQFQYTPPGS